jgi:hypothetical protein
MRVSPTAIDYSTIAAYDNTNIVGSPTSVVLVAAEGGKDYAKVALTFSSGITQYRPYVVITNNSTSGYLGFSAEL